MSKYKDEDEIPCAYCGEYYRRDEYPVRHYAKCKECYKKPHSLLYILCNKLF